MKMVLSKVIANNDDSDYDETLEFFNNPLSTVLYSGSVNSLTMMFGKQCLLNDVLGYKKSSNGNDTIFEMLGYVMDHEEYSSVDNLLGRLSRSTELSSGDRRVLDMIKKIILE